MLAIGSGGCRTGRRDGWKLAAPLSAAAVLTGLSGGAQAMRQDITNGLLTMYSATTTQQLQNQTLPANNPPSNFLTGWDVKGAGGQDCVIVNHTFTTGASGTPNCVPGSNSQTIVSAAENPGNPPGGGNIVSMVGGNKFIAQTFSVVAGDTYVVSFAESGINPLGSSGSTTTISWSTYFGYLGNKTCTIDQNGYDNNGPTDGSFCSAVTGATSGLVGISSKTFASSSNPGWTVVTETFVASLTGAASIYFVPGTSTTSNGQSGLALIAGISVPEPPEMATLAVFGIGVGALARSRRRRQNTVQKPVA